SPSGAANRCRDAAEGTGGAKSCRLWRHRSPGRSEVASIPDDTISRMRLRYSHDPHPHLVVEEIVAPATYRQMRFPESQIRQGASWGLTTGDPDYESVLRDPLWRALHDELRGEAFVRTILDLFADDMRASGCLVDPARARLTPFVESRAEKEMPVLTTEAD